MRAQVNCQEKDFLQTREKTRKNKKYLKTLRLFRRSAHIGKAAFSNAGDKL
jgi:hypothetical protein